MAANNQQPLRDRLYQIEAATQSIVLFIRKPKTWTGDQTQKIVNSFIDFLKLYSKMKQRKKFCVQNLLSRLPFVKRFCLEYAL